MDINELTIDQNLLERINPVFNTAKMTLFQLSAAGDQDAVRISDKLGLTLENTNRVSTPEEMIHNIIVLETRFRTMGALAEETGFTEVDLPCGYTPRAIEFARKGKRFVGLDLPAAITEAEPAITSLISSAGLRALLMMQKRCEQGVTIRNINEVVKEILGQTGFDSILHIAG